MTVELKEATTLANAPFNKLLIVESDILKIINIYGDLKVDEAIVQRGAQLYKLTKKIADARNINMEDGDTILLVFMDYGEPKLIKWNTKFTNNSAKVREADLSEVEEVANRVQLNDLVSIASLMLRPIIFDDPLDEFGDVTIQVSLNDDATKMTITKIYKGFYSLGSVTIEKVGLTLNTRPSILNKIYNSEIHSRMLERNFYLDAICKAIDLFHTDEVDEEIGDSGDLAIYKANLFANNLYKKLPKKFLASTGINTPKTLLAYCVHMWGINRVKDLAEESLANGLSEDTPLRPLPFNEKSLCSQSVFRS